MAVLSLQLTCVAAALLCVANAASLPPLSVCQSLSQKISKSSDVIYATDVLNFTSDIEHWFTSSTQIPTCILEAGAAQDVSTAIKLIAENKTPFAVRSGGHSSNPGFSSTKGVQISFQRMKQIDLSADNSTVEIGMGQDWASIYEAFEDMGAPVNVVGGRVPGPGVGGFTLGGGFSWKTNQFGLTADNVKSYNIVFPNGTISTIDSTQPDLFFAMKGGLNRFGIVTSAVYYTHPQVPTVYAGVSFYNAKQAQAVVNATAAFYQQNTDPKTQIITTLQGGPTGITPLVLFFHDGPTKPTSFSVFDNIKPLFTDVKAQSFSSFISAVPSKLAAVENIRGRFDTLSTTKLTEPFLAAVMNQTNYYIEQSLLRGGLIISFDIEPFLNYGQHAVESAYPHSDSPLPLNAYFAWSSPEEDDYFINAMKDALAQLKQVAIAEGIYNPDFTMYPNYALSDASATDLYGSTNAARLAAIRQRVDPNNVMELTSGYAV